MTENTAPKQRGGFKPGQSGNPAGEPKGARNKTALAKKGLLEGEASRRLSNLLARPAVGAPLECDRVTREHLT